MISMNLKYLRTQSGYSQEKLAEKINVSRQTVAKWENGETLPDIIKCGELAKLYDVSLDELVSIPFDEKIEVKDDPTEGKYVFGIVKVGERGQIVIPKHAREVYQIKQGDKLIVVGDDRGIAIAKIKTFPNFGFGS